MPLVAAVSQWSPFYVDPVTRLLCTAPVQARRRWRDEKSEQRSLTQRWLPGGRLLFRIKGLWFECRMEAFPRRVAWDEGPLMFDLNAHRLLSRKQAGEIYGHEVRCVAKRQLSHRELKDFCLVNRTERNRQQVATRLADDCASCRSRRGCGRVADLSRDFQLLAGRTLG